MSSLVDTFALYFIYHYCWADPYPSIDSVTLSDPVHEPTSQTFHFACTVACGLTCGDDEARFNVTFHAGMTEIFNEEVTPLRPTSKLYHEKLHNNMGNTVMIRIVSRDFEQVFIVCAHTSLTDYIFLLGKMPSFAQNSYCMSKENKPWYLPKWFFSNMLYSSWVYSVS